jgi:3-methyladenine DNA glycosylase/8-oxoguanine DNA glycosylase
VGDLEAIPGVGPWTAQYIAMRACAQPDAFPSGDLGLRRAAGNGAGPISPAELETRAEAWRPWRAYAAMHLWITSGNGQIRAPARDTTAA